VERTEYQKTYPNYCRTCRGWGTIVGLRPDIDISDCEECIAKEHCPRCGQDALDEMDTCSNCGWYRDDNNRGSPGSAEAASGQK
jgi:ribosomal protein L37E